MKQTAVEWFFKALIENQDKTHKQIEFIFEQAKAMEKEQIIKAHTNGWNKGIQNELTISQEYYKQTYESNT
jgi:hypothetical protein